MTDPDTPAVLVEIGRRSAWFRGPYEVVVPAIKLARSPRQHDAQRRAFMVPVAFASDVIAAIEFRLDGDVTVESVDR